MITTNIHAFVIVTTILCGLMGIVWNKSNFLNLSIKAIFLGVTVWGIYLILRAF